MANYKPVIVQSFPKLGEKVTKDTLYWKNYKAPIQIKEFGAVNKIDFSPIPPYNYAVTASSRIHIYGRYSQEPVKTFSRFKDVAYCATYRDDGKLLVAGSEDGSVRLFDISGRAPLRQFDGHTKAVHVVNFLSDKYRIVSGADDYTSKPEDETLVVGMTNGILNVKHRKHEGEKEHLQRRGPAYRTFVKGRNYMPKQEDFFVSKPVKNHLKKYDMLLKRFEVSKALDAVLQ
ncbi:hypothetical protein EYD10_03822, partial [Varanus komodoensis]